MHLCYCCLDPLTNRNRSAEHIFPSALGGHQVSYKLLCRLCNVRLGETIDAALALRFHETMKSLNVSPDRKNTAGRSARWAAIIYGRFGLGPAGAGSEIGEAETHQMEEDVRRALCKVAVNTYLHNGGLRSLLDAALISFINGSSDASGYPHIKLKDLMSPAQPIHSIRILSQGNNGQLQAELTIFGNAYCSLLLNARYQGPAYEYSYRMDLHRSTGCQ
ncbi:MAG: HNH endonuclease [Sphingobacteriales bacterium]|nr:MAG: HNH endonuclease [Sphingobacteriales bacterium]